MDDMKLRCSVCNTEQEVPHHCMKPMHERQIDGKLMLSCWMGPSCGKQELPMHCNKPMRVINDSRDNDAILNEFMGKKGGMGSKKKPKHKS